MFYVIKRNVNVLCYYYYLYCFILETSKEEKDENDISEETKYDMNDREEIGINDFIILNKNFLKKIEGKQDYHKSKEDLNLDIEENLDTEKGPNGGRTEDHKANINVKKNDKSQKKDEAAHHNKENRDQTYGKSQNKHDKAEAQNEENEDRRSDKPQHKKHDVDHESIDSNNLDDYHYDDNEGEDQVRRTSNRGEDKKSDFEDYEGYEDYNDYDDYGDYDDFEQDPNKARNNVRRK